MLVLPMLSAPVAPPDSGRAEIWGDELDGCATTTNQHGLDTNKRGSTLPWINNGTNWWNRANDACGIAGHCSCASNGGLMIVNQPCAPTTHIQSTEFLTMNLAGRRVTTIDHHET
jgi:hypothetical protein